MAESLRDLVVSLSLNSDNCSANLRSINQQMKEADSQFKLAAYGVANFENTTAGAQAQLQALQQKFQLQQQAVQQYERALEAAKGKLETSVQAHEKLAAKLETAKQRYADLGQQVDKLTADLQEAEAAGLKGTDGRTNSDNTGRAARYMTQWAVPLFLVFGCCNSRCHTVQ